MKILIAAGFIILTAISFFLLLRILRPAMTQRAFRITTISILLWVIFLTLWSVSGMAARFELFPVNMAPVLVVPLVAILFFTFGKSTKTIIDKIDRKAIVYLQTFRVFVEILLWALFVENLLPVQMTFEGRNWDILSGLTAPFAAMFLVRSKWALAIWNIVTLGLLINIVSIALLSFPGPLRVFMNEPANFIVAEFPFILLPGMLVPLAYALSLLSLRQIFSLNSQNEETSAPASNSRVV